MLLHSASQMTTTYVVWGFSCQSYSAVRSESEAKVVRLGLQHASRGVMAFRKEDVVSRAMSP